MKLSSSLPVALGALIALSAGCKDTTQPTPITSPAPPAPPPAPPLPSGNYIYISHADGSEITLLARGQSPNWPPDGRRVAYHSGRDGDAEIFVVKADGSGETQITHNTGGNSKPQWSPRGDRIAFTRDRAGGAVASSMS